MQEVKTYTYSSTPEERKVLKAEAFRHGMNISQYIRFLVEQETERQEARKNETLA